MRNGSSEATCQETIAAIATPPGRGGIGIIRVSGPESFSIACNITLIDPIARHAHFCVFHNDNGNPIDKGLAIFFKAPNSYTGEDVLELQGHGGPIVLDLILKRVVELGCRIARPGEFTERAFLNDKMDLTQAEAVSDLIESGSTQAAQAALQSLQGVFSEKINNLLTQLIELRVYIESALDFVEEEIDFLDSDEIHQRIKKLIENFNNIERQAKQGRLLKEGMRVVIAGEPNVGKSSLLNSLTGNDSAIVTSIPGTTRDVLSEQIHIDGMPLHIIDTAGIRDSDDPIELEGIKRAYKQIANADRVIVLSTADDKKTHRPSWVMEKTPVDFVFNKIDLGSINAKKIQVEESVCIYLSAKTGDGVPLLKAHLKSSMGFDLHTEGNFTARRRHLDALRRTRAYVDKASEHLLTTGSGELAAEELRYAQNALNEITGEFTSDDLIGEIFSSFCIGK